MMRPSVIHCLHSIGGKLITVETAELWVSRYNAWPAHNTVAFLCKLCELWHVESWERALMLGCWCNGCSIPRSRWTRVLRHSCEIYYSKKHCELLWLKSARMPLLELFYPSNLPTDTQTARLCNDWRRSSQLSVVYCPSGKPPECGHCWVTGWWRVLIAPMQAHRRQRFSMNQWINTYGNNS